MEKDHGRIETRRAVTLEAATLLGGLRGAGRVVGRAERGDGAARREPAAGSSASVERRFFLSSLDPDAARLLQVARGHRALENPLH